MAEIGKFSMIIAHELKNPLGIIKGSVDILDKPATEAVTQETMKSYIRDEVKRLNKLIEDFLAFARPMPPQKTFADVNDTVRKISGHFMIPEELNKDISLQIDLGDPPRIAIDENQIYQALLNLINNAVQAIEQKGEIHIKTDCQDRRVRIQVSDSGPGLSAEVKNKIFEPFFTTKAKGSGLGLTIVKKFVENHSGYIEVADFSEGGTTVSMFFPMQEI
jgi:signal transduction histidine kinase